MFMLKYPFWHFFSLTKGKGEVWLGGTQPVLLPELSYIFIRSFRYVAVRVFSGHNTIYLAFFHHRGNHFPDYLAHILSWVKTYHQAKFQRNPPTGLARMMVQTYRQTPYLLALISEH